MLKYNLYNLSNAPKMQFSNSFELGFWVQWCFFNPLKGTQQNNYR